MISGLNSLLFAILSSAAIFIVFKASDRYSRDTLVLICYNYLVAFLFSAFATIESSDWSVINQKMIYPAIITGVLFIAVFFIISLSARFAGVARTTLASKMSFVIPVIFSVIFYNESLYLDKLIGLLLTLLAVFMAVYEHNKKSFKIQSIILPLILFIGAGIVDSFVKFIQQRFLTHGGEHLFSTIVFGIAFILSFLIVVFTKKIKHMFIWNRVIGGFFLGFANYGSLYFLIKTLNSEIFDSSVIFCLVNMGIVLFNVIIGIYIFKEKISLLNKLGVFLAFVAIFILTFV